MSDWLTATTAPEPANATRFVGCFAHRPTRAGYPEIGQRHRSRPIDLTSPTTSEARLEGQDGIAGQHRGPNNERVNGLKRGLAATQSVTLQSTDINNPGATDNPHLIPNFVGTEDEPACQSQIIHPHSLTLFTTNYEKQNNLNHL